jgi:predicted nucleic acid-binding protein
MRYLLDTSALLAHYRQESGSDEVQALFEADEAELMVASITLTEFGRRLHDLGAADKEVEGVLSAYEFLLTDVVPVDIAVARAAFVIGCRTPRRLPLADALIAAAAQTRNAVLVHRDEHMRSIPAKLLRQKELAAGPGERGHDIARR